MTVAAWTLAAVGVVVLVRRRRRRLAAEAEAAFAEWERRQAVRRALEAERAEQRRLSLVDADMVVAESARYALQSDTRRTVRLHHISVPCSSFRHHACRPDEWGCDCRCHDVAEVAS